MMLDMLLTEDIPEVPDTLKVIENYGKIGIIGTTEPENVLFAEGELVQGEHIIVEGSDEAIIEWLRGEHVWVGNGVPQMQEFTLRTVKEE